MGDFIASLSANLNNHGVTGKFYDSSNLVEKRIMEEYGAVFLNPVTAVKFPNKCRFKNEDEVSAYQGAVKRSKQKVGGIVIELQETAINALLKAIKQGVKITPKGKNPARRSFETVRKSWNGTVVEGADYWSGKTNSKGKTLTAKEAQTLKTLTGDQQIKRVLELEQQGFSFHPDRARSIAIYTAIPGASQHLLMLALDLVEYTDKRVRVALADNGWFQTVFSDRPHFTYLGLQQKKLSSLGLKTEKFENREFWIPDI